MIKICCCCELTALNLEFMMIGFCCPLVASLCAVTVSRQPLRTPLNSVLTNHLRDFHGEKCPTNWKHYFCPKNSACLNVSSTVFFQLWTARKFSQMKLIIRDIKINSGQNPCWSLLLRSCILQVKLTGWLETLVQECTQTKTPTTVIRQQGDTSHLHRVQTGSEQSWYRTNDKGEHYASGPPTSSVTLRRLTRCSSVWLHNITTVPQQMCNFSPFVLSKLGIHHSPQHWFTLFNTFSSLPSLD